jgi:cytoskeletal protein RodZ
MLPKDSAEESAAKHNMQDKAVNSNATSMLGADFSHPASPKMVVPLSKRDGGSTSAGRYRRRKLQIIWFSVAVLVVQIGIAVITFIRLPKPTLQPTTGQAQSHLNDGPTQASSVPPATGDNSAQKTAQAATSPPASEETIAEYNKKIDEQQQTIAENKKKIDEQQRKINNLEKKLVFEAGKLEHSKTEFLETAQQRDKLEADMKRETLRL